MRRVYLDSNATTPVRPEVVAAMIPVFGGDYGNPSSIHWFGQQAKSLVDDARQQVARLIHAEPSEIVFVSGGTEADNLAIRGIAEAQKAKGRHIITSKIEHHAVLHTCRDLEKQGWDVTWLDVSRDGLVDPQDVRRAIRPDTVLITIMHANNETVPSGDREIGVIAEEATYSLDGVNRLKDPVDARKLRWTSIPSPTQDPRTEGVGAVFAGTT
jgi:cysteine desulfurase